MDSASWFASLSIIIALLCAVLGVFFIFRRKKLRKGTLYLGAHLLIGAIDFAIPIYANGDLALWFFFLLKGFSGVTLHLFFMSYVGFYANKNKAHLLLLSPILVVGIALGIMGESPNSFQPISAFLDVFNGLFIIWTGYIIWVKKTDFSITLSKRQIIWLKALIFVYLLLVILTYIIESALLSFPEYQLPVAFAYMIISIVYLLALFYTGLSYPEIIVDNQALKSHVKSLETKYEYSDLNQGRAHDILNRTDNKMTLEKLYKNPELSLNKLSLLVGVDKRELSQAINQYKQKSVREYVNEFRIKEAKQLLGSDDVRVNEVMFEVGFNSRSSFNIEFKKQVGMSPSQYRNQLNTD